MMYTRMRGVRGRVRRVLFRVVFFRAGDPATRGLVSDEGSVLSPSAASADPAFGYRVHPGCPDVAEHGPGPGIGEDRAERSRVVRAAVADHELDQVRLLAQGHDQVPGLLGGPLPGWMPSDAEDADAPGAVLAH